VAYFAVAPVVIVAAPVLAVAPAFAKVPDLAAAATVLAAAFLFDASFVLAVPPAALAVSVLVVAAAVGACPLPLRH